MGRGGKGEVYYTNEKGLIPQPSQDNNSNEKGLKTVLNIFDPITDYVSHFLVYSSMR